MFNVTFFLKFCCFVVVVVAAVAVVVVVSSVTVGVVVAVAVVGFARSPENSTTVETNNFETSLTLSALISAGRYVSNYLTPCVLVLFGNGLPYSYP